MKRRRTLLILALIVVAGAVVYTILEHRNRVLTLTGIVTTNDVIVSPQIAGQVGRLLVTEGDTVAANQLLAVLTPDEYLADRAYYAHTAQGYAQQVAESEAALRFQEQQTTQQIRQAEANLAATEAQRVEASADVENTKLIYERDEALFRNGNITTQEVDQARTNYTAAQARLDAATKQIEAQKAALALAQSNAEQVAMKRSQLTANRQQREAAEAQKTKADVRLAYTELRAPIAGTVDVRAVRQGETVNPGQAIVTLINPDDLWVRVDVEETYIDRIRLGDKLTVRLPSGEERPGTVFFRGLDAGFATQRDVSRTKRDIKTFELRLRVDNRDRRLAVGMTAYVLLPVGA